MSLNSFLSISYSFYIVQCHGNRETGDKETCLYWDEKEETLWFSLPKLPPVRMSLSILPKFYNDAVN